MKYKIRMFFLRLKWRIQRFKRGYSDSDCWDIDTWFYNIMPSILTTYLNTIHGWPGEGIFENINSFEDWKNEIRNLRNLFLECNYDTCSQVNQYEDFPFEFNYKDFKNLIPEDQKDEWEAYCNRLVEIDDYVTQNKYKAMLLFMKYIRYLWD